jgi:hypothetical protein
MDAQTVVTSDRVPKRAREKPSGVAASRERLERLTHSR